jgi:undecaprenyl-diphosphatase
MDLAIVEWFQSIRNGVFDAFFSLITEFGGDLVFLVIGTILFWLYDKRFGYKYMTIFLFTLGINDTLKNLIRRPRPFLEGVSSVGEETYGFAMPSAHASNAGISAFLLNERFKDKKSFVTPVIFTLLVLVAISRIYLAQHYLTDVIAGVALAYIVFVAINYGKQKITLNPLYIVSIGLGLLFIFMIIFGVFYEDFGITTTESFRNLYIAFGSILGLTLGHYTELKYIDFNEKTTPLKMGIRYLVGLIIALVFQEGLKVVLPYGDTQTLMTVILDSIRYFILTLWLALGAPFVFKKFIS